MRNFLNTLSYSKYVIFHPFDGFYEIKYREKGNAIIATIFFVLNAILAVLSVQYNGFLLNFNYAKRMNSILIILFNLSPLLLFIIGNYSTTTLFNGKGQLREIYIVVGYSLLPLVMIKSIAIIFSHFITYEEVALYGMLLTTGILWSYFLVFSGLIIIHDYGFFKNILTLLATALAIAIITFVGLLFFSLLQQVIAFIQIFFKEAVIRIEGWLSA